MIETTNNQPTRSTQDAGELLTRIDAILDELYALREAVREWVAVKPDIAANDTQAVHEPVKELVPDASDMAATVFVMRRDETPSDTPLTDSLVGAAGKGTWDEVYTNAEIVHMRFGEE